MGRSFVRQRLLLGAVGALPLHLGGTLLRPLDHCHRTPPKTGCSDSARSGMKTRLPPQRSFQTDPTTTTNPGTMLAVVLICAPLAVVLSLSIGAFQELLQGLSGELIGLRTGVQRNKFYVQVL